MALTIGTRLGPYKVTTQIGVGGMGEVYRGRDTRLKRDVALKVLPDAVANDPDRLARFQREAEVLASLNHPNIAAIHGLEESNGTRALVMELVEGPTLADRIAQGPIPVDEALPIATQIAEALDDALLVCQSESNTFTVPSGRSLMFAGFRSRWRLRQSFHRTSVPTPSPPPDCWRLRCGPQAPRGEGRDKDCDDGVACRNR